MHFICTPTPQTVGKLHLRHPTKSHPLNDQRSLNKNHIFTRCHTTKSAKLEAQLLLQHALNVNRAWLIAHEHENISPSIEAAYSQGWVLEPTRLLPFQLS